MEEVPVAGVVDGEEEPERPAGSAGDVIGEAGRGAGAAAASSEDGRRRRGGGGEGGEDTTALAMATTRTKTAKMRLRFLPPPPATGASSVRPVGRDPATVTAFGEVGSASKNQKMDLITLFSLFFLFLFLSFLFLPSLNTIELEFRIALNGMGKERVRKSKRKGAVYS